LKKTNSCGQEAAYYLAVINNLSFILFIIFTMADLNDEIAELKADIRSIKTANPNWASDTGLINAIAAKDTRIAGLEARLAPGKPPPSTSLLSSSSFHPLFDFIFLFNSHAILSLLGFSFPVIYL
jgi:hypothetical protein